MSCDALNKSFKDLEAKINKLNAAEISHRQEIAAGKSPEDVKDILVHQRGLVPELADAMMTTATGWHPDMLKLLEAQKEVEDNAMSFQSQAQAPNASTVDKSFLKQKSDAFREKLVDGLARSFNYLPRGMNDVLARALKQFATFKDFTDELKPGSKVFAGRNARRLIDGEVTNLHKSSGSTMKLNDFREALQGIAKTREDGMGIEDIGPKLDAMKKEVDGMISDGKYMVRDVSVKDMSRRLSLAKDALNLPGVKNYIADTYRKMDIAGEVAFGENSKKGYYHNHRIVEPEMDLWDAVTMGDRKSYSTINESKVFKNGWEAELKGYGPATHDFVEANGTYWSAIGNKLRKKMFSDKLKTNAGLAESHPDKMMIAISSDKSEPAFYDKSTSPETPKTADGRYYKEMDNLGDQFKGILVHPEVYKWQEKVFRHMNPTGIASGALKGMKMWRTLVLSGAAPIHGASLAKKYAYMSANLGLQDGVNSVLGAKSSMMEGLSSLDVNSPKFASAMKLMHNGLSLETYDMSRNAAFDRKFNKSGDQTMMSTLSENIKNFSNWQHKLLFEKWRTGLKLGLGLRILESDYFKDLTSKHGGDSNKAMSEVATMLNDHFGGQNLEMIGRSRIVQSIMQALLLSPEWTEAKFKRTYGAFINPNDQIRRAYQVSLAAEMGTMLISKILLQQIYNAQNPDDQRSMEQIADDIWNRKLASVYIGKSKVGKTEKEIFVNFGQSENQDLGLLLPAAKGIYDGFHTGDITQVPKQFAKEMAHKLAPPVKSAIDMMGRQTPEKKEGWGAKTLAAGEAMLPISAAQTLQSAQGETGASTLGTLAGSIAGLPVQSYNKKKEKKDKKEHSMRFIK